MATVIHRTTKQFLKSVHTPSHPSNLWIHNPDMSGVEGVEPVFWKIDGDLVSEMSSAEKDAAHLPDHKAEKCEAIDVKTDELISQGFVYSTKTFSLSLPAQSRIIGIHEVKDQPELVYPVTWNTLDDSDTVDLADSTEVHAFYLTALGTYRAHVDDGTDLKDQVRVATTIAEVDAIEDPR
jgi:hypothetical protein